MEQAEPAKRGRGRPKGSTGVAARAKRQAARERAIEYVDDAWRALGEVCRDQSAPASARVSAAGQILDRAYGRPPVAVEGHDGGPVEAVITWAVEARQEIGDDAPEDHDTLHTS